MGDMIGDWHIEQFKLWSGALERIDDKRGVNFLGQEVQQKATEARGLRRLLKKHV